jgi:hypothetical protein
MKRAFLLVLFSLFVTMALSAQRWEVMNLPRLLYTDISVGDSLHIWVTTDSCLWRTSDAGQTWETSVYDSGMSVYGIWYFGEGNGWALGYNRIYKTSDGGQTWELNFRNNYLDYAIIGAMNMSDSLVGTFTIYDMEYNDWWFYFTTNGGLNWDYNFTSIGQTYMVTRTTGWASEYYGEAVYRTLAGPGYGWHGVFGASFAPISIQPIDSLICWALVGPEYVNPGLYRTSNGGQTWDYLDTTNYSNFVFNRLNMGLLSRDRCLYTYDGGDTWLECPQPPTHAHNMQMALNGEVWCQSSYSILHFIPPARGAVNPIKETLPEDYSLTAYPNPFNSTAMISFSLPKASAVRLEVFNVLGQRAYEADLGTLNAGKQLHRFDGSKLASGVYLATLHAGAVTRTQKLLLVR